LQQLNSFVLYRTLLGELSLDGHTKSGLKNLPEIENQAGIARITCGWKRPELDLEVVRKYWRDVHSPAIARRAGIYEYRHNQFEAVDSSLFKPIKGVNYGCASDKQLMWLSDVRYRDEAALVEFGKSPDGEVKNLLLADIEIIVDKSSTYKATGENATTYLDITGDPTPQGRPTTPSYSVFFRQFDDEQRLHSCVRLIAQKWATQSGVKRVRLNIFEAPDMEAEKKAGYPIKTHPKELQYQAWIELIVAEKAVANSLLSPTDGFDYAAIQDIHAYPVAGTYSSVYQGRPTIVGLRGFNAYEAITALKASNQCQTSLLTWMYGDIVQDGPAKVETS
jgi:hypothetical protein